MAASNPFLVNAAEEIESDLIQFGELRPYLVDLWTFAGFDPEAYRQAQSVLSDPANATYVARLQPILEANLEARSVLAENPRDSAALATIKETEDALITSEDVAHAQSLLRSNPADPNAKRKIDLYSSDPHAVVVVDALNTSYKFRHAQEQLRAIEGILKLPITGDLDRLVENYKAERYTFDCLQVGHPNKFCWKPAVARGNIDAVREILGERDSLNWPKFDDIADAIDVAVQNNDGDLLDLLLDTKVPEDYLAFGMSDNAFIAHAAEEIANRDRMELLPRLYNRIRELAGAQRGGSIIDLVHNAIEYDRPAIIDYIWTHAQDNEREEVARDIAFLAGENERYHYIDYLIQRAPDLRELIYSSAFEGAIPVSSDFPDETIPRMVEWLPYVDEYGLQAAINAAATYGLSNLMEALIKSPRLTPEMLNSAFHILSNQNLDIFSRLLDEVPGPQIPNLDFIAMNVAGPGATFNVAPRTEEQKISILTRLLPFITITPDLVVAAMTAGDANVANFLVWQSPNVLGPVADAVINRIPAVAPIVSMASPQMAYVLDARANSDQLLLQLRRLAMNTGALSEDINDYLVWAARIGSPTLVRYLLKRGADPHFADNSPLVAAELSGNAEVVAILKHAF